jgi:fluoroacetyl-CoA thioesterase
VEGKKLTFKVEAHDGVDVIAQGRHERVIVNRAKFDAKMAAKGAARQR